MTQPTPKAVAQTAQYPAPQPVMKSSPQSVDEQVKTATRTVISSSVSNLSSSEHSDTTQEKYKSDDMAGDEYTQSIRDEYESENKKISSQKEHTDTIRERAKSEPDVYSKNFNKSIEAMPTGNVINNSRMQRRAAVPYLFDEKRDTKSPDDSVGHKLFANFANGFAHSANNHLRDNTSNIIGDMGDKIGLDMSMNPFQRIYFLPVGQKQPNSFAIQYTGFDDKTIPHADVNNALMQSVKEYLPQEMSRDVSFEKEDVATRSEMNSSEQNYSPEALGIDEKSKLRAAIKAMDARTNKTSLNPSLSISQSHSMQAGMEF